MERSVIVFDLGGVLIDWNPRHFYRNFFGGNEEEMEWFLAEVCNYEWNSHHDLGATFEENSRGLIEQYPQYKAAIQAYFFEFEKMLGPPMQGSLDIVKELSDRGQPLYVLTNWSAETFPRAREIFPFLSWFKGIVVSGEVRMAKPDPAIFYRLLDTFSFRAEEAVFIDDREENVVAAERIGFYPIHFQSPQHLRHELVSLGLLTSRAL
ncbi:MAG: HAD family phosphatase [Deltaproteobacteria bacterium]|nr:HAD family phosphatase [Deltaproteobacteria bacterium]